jgi:hypothetical protein
VRNAQKRKMKKLILIILTFLTTKSFGQLFNYRNELDFIKFYPSNKNIIDTFSSLNLLDYLNNLDTINNTIYQKLTANDYTRIYKMNGDTIKSYKYNFKKREFTSVEVFVYNHHNQIEFYIDCTDYYFDKKKIPVEAIQFFYNSENELTDKLVYYQQNYNSNINEYSTFDLQNFKLTSAKNYTLKKSQTKTLIFSKECIGKENFRSYDTTIVNNKGLIIKHNSYADKRALGCLMGLNVNDICEYSYLKDSVELISTQTHCTFPGENKKCIEYAEPYISKSKRKYYEFAYNYRLCKQLRNNMKKQEQYIIK